MLFIMLNAWECSVAWFEILRERLNKNNCGEHVHGSPRALRKTDLRKRSEKQNLANAPKNRFHSARGDLCILY